MAHERIISQAAARRTAQAWGARLPSAGRILWQNRTRAETMLDGGASYLRRDKLWQWRLGRARWPGDPEIPID